MRQAHDDIASGQVDTDMRQTPGLDAEQRKKMQSQNKDSVALHLKLNELLAANKIASNRMIGIEGLDEEQLQQVAAFYVNLAARARERSLQGMPLHRRGRLGTARQLRRLPSFREKPHARHSRLASVACLPGLHPWRVVVARVLRNGAMWASGS
ncbi:Polyunsaturated fatty acid lipoxygenase ALOX15B [Manis javanica]|nr:Polyunsaturated fatty acid lipoxygenase ALOX15B [Manis javanica]